MIPANHIFSFLIEEKGPRHILMAQALYGTAEKWGANNNPTILAWAKELGIERIYKEDSMPWCGLFVAICLARAGGHVPRGYDTLRALKWADWGEPAAKAMLGDILVFSREGGGHVGFYVGENTTHYYVLGGNQSDAVNISAIKKSRCVAISRPPYINQPANIRTIVIPDNANLLSNGGVTETTNEA